MSSDYGDTYTLCLPLSCIDMIVIRKFLDIFLSVFVDSQDFSPTLRTAGKQRIAPLSPAHQRGISEGGGGGFFSGLHTWDGA